MAECFSMHQIPAFVIYLINVSASQGIPDSVNPMDFLKLATRQMRHFCPSGITKCECIHAPGTFTEGPFYGDEDPIGTLFTFVGCNPGKIPFCLKIFKPLITLALSFQASVSVRTTLRRRWT